MTEYCENELFSAHCEPNQVVVVNQARYGRMREGRCITSAYGKIGCGLDVQGLIDHEYVQTTIHFSCESNYHRLSDMHTNTEQLK